MTSPEEATGVGAELAAAREAKGLTVAQAGLALRLMPRQIEAMEAERFAALPGPTIARGMVRNYARHLGLDPEPLLARLAGRLPAADATPNLAARFSQPVPFTDSGRRSTFVHLAVSALVLGTGAFLAYEWRDDAPPTQFVAPEPAAPVTQTASLGPVPAPAEAPGPATPVADPAPAKDDPPKSFAEPRGVQNRLVLRFDQEAWAEVTDGAGRLLIASLNAAGTERIVQGRPPFSLVIGNAQHVRVSYNDRVVDLQPHVKVEVARFTLK